jgi:hypothetical protein
VSPVAVAVAYRLELTHVDIGSHTQLWQDTSKKPTRTLAEEALKEYAFRTYTYAELTASPLPKGVDPTRLEVCLSYVPRVIFADFFFLSRRASTTRNL